MKLDCSKIKKVFGWKPVWDVEKAIEKTVEWTNVYFAGEKVAECMDAQIQEFFDK